VLTLAYMDEDSLLLTLETREIHLYSRSRREIWRKGATSGNIQRVRQIRYDCDGDALVALVEPVGPACHTGERSCFYRDLEGTADPGVDASAVPGEPAPTSLRGAGSPGAKRCSPRQRRQARGELQPSSCSRTRALAGDKVREEASEVVKAVSSESEERVAEEGADVVYHLAVLLLSPRRPRWPRCFRS